MTKLTNSQGKILYLNPENIKKAMKRRKSQIFGRGLLKYNDSISAFKKERHSIISI